MPLQMHEARFVRARDFFNSDDEYEDFSYMITNIFTWGDVDHSLVSKASLRSALQTRSGYEWDDELVMLCDRVLEIVDALPDDHYISL